MFALVTSVLALSAQQTDRFLATATDISQCPALTPRSTGPSSIRDVRADDIKVIGALGDSITAGYVAKGFSGSFGLDDLIEYRGVSYSVGGDKGVQTVGNYFAKYNSALVGRSLGQNGLLGGAGANRNGDVAVTGAVVGNVGNQVSNLVSYMKANSKDFKNDYKYITLFIGANDLCTYCNNLVSADTYEAQIRSTLESIRTQIPRVIVNIPQLFNVSGLYPVTANDANCKKQRSSFFVVTCKCAFDSGTAGDNKRATMDNLAVQYNQRLVKIRNDYQAKNYNDFMMTTDPASGTFSLVNAGISFLSTADCFHPNTKAHALFATSVWNNLFKPYDQKSPVFDLGAKIMCPTEDMRISA
ncbi:GDSL-like Lipase/Acylhydrolase-domain-containing protein [Gorgonomyces haynaldii]|nr:GDSL-like Lipase/Acylhydrolase-domain-containing protein [Gorgonomyces haynaldii]